MPEQVTSKELLPCAHCGGAAQLTEVEPMHYVVECSEPMCNMSTRVYISAMDDSRPLAIEAWNRRVAVEPPAVDVAPIAKLTVRDGLVQRAGLYAPGLPDGDHDVFPVPLSPKGELRPHVLAEPPSAPPYDRDKYPTARLAAEAFAEQYVDSYETIGEDAEGREGNYTPTDQEDTLIRDAIRGLMADEDFVDLIATMHAERQAQRAAEGRCLSCGCPAGDHYVKCRASVTKDAGECGACDKPGEHCANVHGICSRHGGRAHETSAAPGDDLPQKLRAMRDVPADKLHRSFDAAAKNRGGK